MSYVLAVIHISVEVEEHGDDSAGEAAGREGGGH